MPSLDEHFRAVTRVRPPDDWPGLGDLEPRLLKRPSPRRPAVAALAFVVAAAGLALAVRAFRTGDGPRPPAGYMNGLIAFSRAGPESGLYVMNPDGTGVMRLSSEPGDTDAAWSPDGSRIAFVRFSGGEAGIYVMNADGTEVRRLTDGDSDGGPAWSPDGSRIAFARETRPGDADVGNADIYLADADGTNVVRLTDDPVMEFTPSWSPDGSRIAFVGHDLASGGQPPSPVRLYVMNADGTEVRALGPENVAQPAWSPDGSQIAFVDTETGSIMAIRPDGSEERRIIDVAEIVGGVGLVYSPTWAPDGTKIAFMAGPDATDTHIYVVDRDGSDLTQLTHGQAADAEPSWQPVPLSSQGSPSPETTQSSGETPPSVDPSPSAQWHIGPLGQVSSVLYAFDSVWASWFDESGAWITRIDAETNEVAATIPIEDDPGWVTGGGGMAEGFGSIWVAGGSREGAILQRIDPATNQLVATIPLGGQQGSTGADVAVDRTGVWVGISDLGVGGSSSLVRVDPETNEVVAEVPLPYEYVRRVVAGDGTVVVQQHHWHGQLGEESGPYPIFSAIDVQTNSITATTPESAFWGVWAWNDEVWAGIWTDERGYELVRVDPETLAPVGSPVPLEGDRVWSVRTGEGGIWFVTAAGVDQWKPPIKVNRLNPETGVIDVSVEAPEAPGVDMALGGGAVWFLSYEGDLVRFDLT
jgi:TolB protein